MGLRSTRLLLGWDIWGSWELRRDISYGGPLGGMDGCQVGAIERRVGGGGLLMSLVLHLQGCGWQVDLELWEEGGQRMVGLGRATMSYTRKYHF